MAGGKGAAAQKEGINDIPGQQGPVEAKLPLVGQVTLGKEGLVLGGAGQNPRLAGFQVDGGLGAFKVVDVGVAAFFDDPRVTGDELGKLGFEVNGRRSLGTDQGKLVDSPGDQLAFGRKTGIEAQHQVGDRVHAVIHFLGQGPLLHVKGGGPQVEPVGKSVVGMGPQQTLPLHGEEILTFRRHLDGRSRLQ